jgi:hypothetical protein
VSDALQALYARDVDGARAKVRALSGRVTAFRLSAAITA